MGVKDFVSGELIEIIEWTDDSRDTLAYRFPDDDKEIKRGAHLIVRESQVAQFVYLGQFGDTFRPGRHTLSAAFLAVSQSHGLTSAIMDARSPQIVRAVKAADLLLDRDAWGAAWIAAHRAQQAQAQAPT